MERTSLEMEQVEEIDLRQYISVLLKWKWTILLFTIGCLITSYVVSSFLITPVYETTAVLMATQPNYERIYREDNGSLESTVDSFSSRPNLNINTFTGQFKNSEILANVIKKLDLDELGYTPNSLAQNIIVTGNEDTNMIEVKVLNTDPALAESITNTLIEEFYAFLFSSNQKQAKESVAYLASQLEQTEEELKKIGEEYQQSKAQARNSDILEKELISKTEILTNSKTLLMQSQIELEQLTAGKKRMEENLANTPAKLVTKRSWTDGEEIPEVMDEFTGEAETPNNNMTSEEINPLYLELIKDLNQKDMEIAQTTAKIAGIASNIKALESEIADIQVELSEKQLEEATVKRKLDTLENAYTVLNNKIIETEITKSADFGRMSLTMVSPAFQPNNPVKPNKALNMAIAFILGLMGGVFLAFVLEFFDDTIKTADDLKKLMDVPVLATIPVSRQ
ncbi:MAG: Wzz/FepE/Etk N-terminal domain-containing protein [Dehalobacterium sp.]